VIAWGANTMTIGIKKSLFSAMRCLALLGCAYSVPTSAAVLCGTGANVAIADGSGSATPGTPATISIVVTAADLPSSPDVHNIVDSLTFDLRINHTYVGDLIATLTSPGFGVDEAPTTVTLMDRPGVPASTFGCFRNNVNATFDDTSGTAVEGQCANPVPAIGGTLNPTGSLSDFDGKYAIGTWTLTVTDNAGVDLGTIITASNCLDLTATTPVTLSSFESKSKGRHLVSEWQTSSESFNIGFHLWGNVDGEWQQLNKRLIASDAIDSVEPLDYRKRIDLQKFDGEVSEIGISSVSASGQEEFYGPFSIGEKYGEQFVPEHVDWTHQRALYNNAMKQAGYTKYRDRWVKNNEKRAASTKRQKKRFPDVILEIKDAAMVRVSYEQLVAQGIDLLGMPIHKMSLSRDGIAVPRSVTAGVSGPRSQQRAKPKPRSKRRFGPGSEIIFYAYGPSDQDARYVGVQPYRLSLDASSVLELTEQGSNSNLSFDIELPPIKKYRDKALFGDKKLYSFGIDGDGWYDSSIRAIGGIGVKTLDIEVAADVDLDEPSTVNISLFGVTSFPRVDVDGDGDLEPNHHYKIYLNRSSFPEAIFEGYANGQEQINVSATVGGQLVAGLNEVQIELIPDNGHNIDLVYFVEGSLSYARPNIMTAASLKVLEPIGAGVNEIDLNGGKLHAVYAVDNKNNVVARKFSKRNGVARLANASNPSQRGLVSLFLLDETGYASPEAIYQAGEAELGELDLADTDYVIIADASLRGEILQTFVDRQNELGRRTKVVSSQVIFDAYSDGSALPSAIAEYLADQAPVSPFQYVLLVGGHTYNYRAYNTDEASQPINLIPSFYRGTQAIAKQIPTAVPFVDFDGDGAPDRAIGRWPVRDLQQLEHIVDKTLVWHAEGSHKDSKTALFIADAKDQQNNFTRSSRRLASSLGLDLNPWQQLEEVMLDEINDDTSIGAGEKIGTARNLIVEGVNQGPALTVYSGHGAPGVWGRRALFYGDVSEKFENSAMPTLMMPLACYTTYYETPNVKSLPEVLLTDSRGGAVAITGSALLSDSGDTERFGRNLLKKMSTKGMDLGTAVLNAKREIYDVSEQHQAFVYNWVTLGDPTLSFALPFDELAPQDEQQKFLTR
jgi:subtilisin-like proprotein convertase family protein